MRGEWMLMGHALFNGVYDWQDGPRGDEKAFLAGMVMGSARRDFATAARSICAPCSAPIRSWARTAIRYCSRRAKPPTA